MGDKAGALSDLKDDRRASSPKRAARPRRSRRCARPPQLNPDDDEVREQLLDVYFARRRLRARARVRDDARAVPHDRRRARRRRRAGRGARDAAPARPRGSGRQRAARRAGARRSSRAATSRRAAEYLTVETAGDDPELLLTVADIQLRGERGSTRASRSSAQLLEQDPARREQIALLGWSDRRAARRSGLQGRRAGRRRGGRADRLAGGRRALQEFVTRVPNHIPALMRLVEICVDGGLEATMYSAQAQLADAYIAAGRPTEARFIAEDLVAREPWETRQHRTVPPRAGAARRARSRRADRGAPERRVAVHEHRSQRRLAVRRSADRQPSARAGAVAGCRRRCRGAPRRGGADRRAGRRRSRRRRSRSRGSTRITSSQLSANAIDLESILGEFDELDAERRRSDARRAATDDVEVDLSIVLDDIKKPPTAARRRQATEEAADLDGVFGNLRDQASRRSGSTTRRRITGAALALRRPATSTAASRRSRRRRARRSCGS